MHDRTAVMGGSNENGSAHFHILCPTGLQSWAVGMKTDMMPEGHKHTG
jgi:hypothetical protein